MTVGELEEQLSAVADKNIEVYVCPHAAFMTKAVQKPTSIKVEDLGYRVVLHLKQD